MAQFVLNCSLSWLNNARGNEVTAINCKSKKWSRIANSIPSSALLPPLWRDIVTRADSRPLPIVRLFRSMENFSATDPRDMVFALYHLATDLRAELFQPDYSRSVAETYSLFTSWLIRTTGSLNTLMSLNIGMSDFRSKNLPSWVPEYKWPTRGPLYLPWVHAQARASGETQIVPKLVTNTLGLHVGGFTVATVAVIVDANAVHDFLRTNRTSQQELHLGELAGVDIPTLWACLNYVYSSKFSPDSPGVQSLEFAKVPNFTLSAFCAVLLQGHEAGVARVAKLWAESDPTFAMLGGTWRYQQQVIWSGNSTPNKIKNKTLRGHSLDGRVFFFSQNGELGLCPEGTQCGDIVVALYGENLPLVLRAREFSPETSLAERLRQGEKYEIVGACYMEGAMKGEMMDSPHWQDSLPADPLDPNLCINSNSGSHADSRRRVYRTEFFYIV